MPTQPQPLTPAQAVLVAEMTRIRESVRRSTNAVLLEAGISGYGEYAQTTDADTQYTEIPPFEYPDQHIPLALTRWR